MSTDNEPLAVTGGFGGFATDFWESRLRSIVNNSNRVSGFIAQDIQEPRSRAIDDVEDIISFEQIMANAKK